MCLTQVKLLISDFFFFFLRNYFIGPFLKNTTKKIEDAVLQAREKPPGMKKT